MAKGNSGGGGFGEEIIDSIWGVSSKRGEEKDLEVYHMAAMYLSLCKFS